ncbi:Bacterial regulatory protein, MarR, partial [mine drainage metagenome]
SYSIVKVGHLTEPGDLLDLLFAAGAAVRRVPPWPDEIGLGRTHLMVLRRLWVPSPHHASHKGERGPARISEIASRFSLTAPAVTQIVDQLERRGFVERQRSERDRRAVIVHITPSGEELLHLVRQQRRAAAEAFLTRLTDDERAVLERILHRLLGSASDPGQESE